MINTVFLAALAWAQTARMTVSDRLPSKSELGQGMVEYMLVLGVIVVAIFLAIQLTGLTTAIGTSLGTLTTCFTNSIQGNLTCS